MSAVSDHNHIAKSCAVFLRITKSDLSLIDKASSHHGMYSLNVIEGKANFLNMECQQYIKIESAAPTQTR